MNSINYMLLVNIFMLSISFSVQAQEITSPQNGTSIDPSNTVFKWSKGSANAFWIYIGSTVGGYDVYNSDSLGSRTSLTVSTRSSVSNLYLRFFYKIGDTWYRRDYQYTNSNTNVKFPELTSHSNNSFLNSSTVTFRWNREGAADIFIYLGSSLGEFDLYGKSSSGSSVTINTVPTDGSIVYFRLWFRYSENENWSFKDYVLFTELFTASDSLYVNNFAKVITSNIDMADSTFSLIEIKKPATIKYLSYAKVRFVPSNDAIITRLIPLKIEKKSTNRRQFEIKMLKMIGSQVGNKIIKRVLVVTDIVDLLVELSDFINENSERASLEYDLTSIYDTDNSIYFLVETSKNTSLEIGATWQFEPNSSKMFDFTFSYPDSKSPF